MWTRLTLGLLWLGFAASWIRVAERTSLHEFFDSLRLLLVLTLGYALLLLAWVLHNFSIYRRKGPRTSVRQAEPLPARDYLGVPIDVRVDPLTESEIVVDVFESRKCYLPRPAASDLIPLARATSGTEVETGQSVQRVTGENA